MVQQTIPGSYRPVVRANFVSIYPKAGQTVVGTIQRWDWWKVPDSGALVFGVRLFEGHTVHMDGLVEWHGFVGRSRIDPTTDSLVSPLIADNGFGGVGFETTPATGNPNGFSDSSFFPQTKEWFHPKLGNVVIGDPGFGENFADVFFDIGSDEHNAAQEKGLEQSLFLPAPYNFELRQGEYVHCASFAAQIVGTPVANASDFAFTASLFYEPLIQRDKFSPRRLI